MTAWSFDFEKAPKDQQILIRNPEWDCPVIAEYRTIISMTGSDSWEGWLFSESVLGDVEGDISIEGCEWCEVPE